MIHFLSNRGKFKEIIQQFNRLSLCEVSLDQNKSSFFYVSVLNRMIVKSECSEMLRFIFKVGCFKEDVRS